MHAGDVDDAAAYRLLPNHLAHDRLSKKESALQVDVHDAVPIFGRDLKAVLDEVDAGVINQTVDAAKLPDCLRHGCLNVGVLGHIARDGHGSAVALPDLDGYAFTCLLAQ